MTDSPWDGAPAPVPAAEQEQRYRKVIADLLAAWDAEDENGNTPPEAFAAFDEAVAAARALLAAALPHVPQAPDDWEEFVVSAFNEGWAAATSGEFQTLAEAYDESHVKLQFGILHERAAHAPSPPTGWQPELES